MGLLVCFAHFTSAGEGSGYPKLRASYLASSAGKTSDYVVLCDIWYKTTPEGKQEQQLVSPEEREILLRELVGHRERAGHDYRRMAASTLGNMCCAEAVDKLIDRLRDASEASSVSYAAASALGRIGDLKALAPLLDALLDNRTEVAEEAARSLHNLKPDAEQIASVATVKRFEALLDKIDGIPLPQSEKELYGNGHFSLCSPDGFDRALLASQLCIGFELGCPAKLPDKVVERARKLAAKMLAAWIPAKEFRTNCGLADMRKFCQTYQPEIFAKKLKSP